MLDERVMRIVVPVELKSRDFHRMFKCDLHRVVFVASLEHVIGGDNVKSKFSAVFVLTANTCSCIRLQSLLEHLRIFSVKVKSDPGSTLVGFSKAKRAALASVSTLQRPPQCLVSQRAHVWASICNKILQNFFLALSVKIHSRLETVSCSALQSRDPPLYEVFSYLFVSASSENRGKFLNTDAWKGVYLRAQSPLKIYERGVS